MSGHEAGQSVEAQSWKVQLPNGELMFMTLDELDDEFQSGGISEGTFVLSPGSTSWEKLGELLGIEAAPETQAAPVAAAPVVVQVAAPAPVVVAPVAQVVPVAYAAPVVQSAPVAFAPSPVSSAAPVTFVPEAPTSMAFHTVANSVRPVVSDLADDLEPEEFRPRKRRAPLVVGFVAVALAAAGIFVARSGALSSGDASAVAAAAAANVGSTPAVVAAAPVVAAPAPVPITISPTIAVHHSFNSEPAPLTDAQKKALAKADAQLNAKHSKRKGGGGGSSKHPMGSQPFHNGGSAGDPLNSKI